MKMGNSVPRAGLKRTSLAFLASVLQLHHIGSLMSPLYLSMQLSASEVSADYYNINNKYARIQVLDSRCQEQYGLTSGYNNQKGGRKVHY